MMSPERAERLRQWHERALADGRRDETIAVTELGWTFVVPPEVYPPHPLGLAELVLAEVADGDRVLDMGTGSGVNAIAAASRGASVVAVDVNPVAVATARANAERNGFAIDVAESDVFANVSGRLDVIVFDPPYRWFAPRNLWERGTADENYSALTRFFAEVGDHLAPGGRIVLGFGTSGDLDYLHRLIQQASLETVELRRVEGEKDGFPVAYFAYRLTAR
jgi:release factor glutamine methyltransferase